VVRGPQQGSTYQLHTGPRWSQGDVPGHQGHRDQSSSRGHVHECCCRAHVAGRAHGVKQRTLDSRAPDAPHLRALGRCDLGFADDDSRVWSQFRPADHKRYRQVTRTAVGRAVEEPRPTPSHRPPASHCPARTESGCLLENSLLDHPPVHVRGNVEAGGGLPEVRPCCLTTRRPEFPGWIDPARCHQCHGADAAWVPLVFAHGRQPRRRRSDWLDAIGSCGSLTMRARVCAATGQEVG